MVLLGRTNFADPLLPPPRRALLHADVVEANRPGGKVVDFLEPPEMVKAVNAELPQEPETLEELTKQLEPVMKHAVHTNHRLFCDKLFAGSDPIGVMGETLTALMNTAMHTYAVSGPLSVIEVSVVKQLAAIAGFPKGDGIFFPGGSASNQMAVICARNRAFPHVPMEGYKADDKPVMFTSELCHYSFDHSASVLGLGRNACRKVPANLETGQMIPSELERMINEAKAAGETPFFVNATAGSTVLGSFDDIVAIEAIGHRENLWVHVDGAWGGAVVLSDKHKHLVKGLENADSFTWNQHKAMGLPNQCSTLLVRDPSVLREANSLSAGYLFHSHEHSEFDLGEKTIQCGRRPDVLKLWMSWKYFGTKGFTERIEKAVDNAAYITKLIATDRKDRNFLVFNTVYLNVCWYYIPPSMQKVYAEKGIDGMDKKELANVVETIYARMQAKGTMLVNFAPLPNMPKFFRLTVNSPKLTHEDMDFVLNEIEELGADL